MLKGIFQELDEWVVSANIAASEQDVAHYARFEIRVIGQAALMECDLQLELLATQDVDAFGNMEHGVRKALEEILARRNLVLDPHAHEGWMPPETEYRKLHQGRFVTALVAEPDYILIAKAKKAPDKNRQLLIEYLAGDPSELFLRLAEKYKVDLEALL